MQALMAHRFQSHCLSIQPRAASSSSAQTDETDTSTTLNFGSDFASVARNTHLGSGDR